MTNQLEVDSLVRNIVFPSGKRSKRDYEKTMLLNSSGRGMRGRILCRVSPGAI
jgi:hypothetical protein